MKANLKIKIILSLAWHVCFFILGLFMPVLQKMHTGYFSDGILLLCICWGISCLPWLFFKHEIIPHRDSVLGTLLYLGTHISLPGLLLYFAVGGVLSPVIMIYIIYKYCKALSKLK